MNKDKIKQNIKLISIILVVVIVIAIAIFKVIKYEVEGEKNMPFQLSKIIVISSAQVNEIDENANQIEGVENEEKSKESSAEDVDATQENSNIENGEQIEQAEEEKFIWNERVIQTNDVYMYIDKNENYKGEEIIKSIKIENIQFLKNVNIGKIQVYMPTSLDGELYSYINDYLVNSTLTYNGADVDNKKNLEIGNQGGCVYFSFANVGLKNYKSNDDTEIAQGAFILEKMWINEEDLKFKVAFDVLIEVSNKTYAGTVILDLPIDGLMGVKESHTEINDFSNVIFKRK